MSDDTQHLEQQLFRFGNEAKKIRASVDRLIEALDTQTDDFLAITPRTIQVVTSYIDTWQHARGTMFRTQSKLVRHLEEARDGYGEGMRRYMNKGLTGKEGTFHYEERAEIYKTKNLAYWKLLRLFESLDAEFKFLDRVYDRKIRWLEDMRRQMRRDDDDFRYASNKDFAGS